MHLPITVPFSNTGEHHGIINKLNKEYKIDLLGEKYLSLSSSKDFTGTISSLVNHGTGYYQSQSDGSSTYIQISFLNGYIFPTGYTLKGSTSVGFYSKSWYVYGIHDGDEKTEGRWETLGINDTSQSTYCNTLTSNGGCYDNRVGSYTLKPMKALLGYKHLRWKTKENCDIGNAFLTTGIDVYGTLSPSKKLPKGNERSVRVNNYNHVYFILIILFGNFILSY